MRLLDLTLPTAAENIALDEALLESAETEGNSINLLRLWESPEVMVVIGRSSRAAEEVDLEKCSRRGIPVLRRTSGGAAIVAGPGCLMYALVLNASRGALPAIDAVHSHVLGTIADSLVPLAPDVMRLGTSDLTIRGRKFSGNSMRCARKHVLYHGTLLYDFSLPHIAELLKTAPRQPEYRQGRAHEAFVCNLPISGTALRAALTAGWGAHEPCSEWPRARVAQLVAEKYCRSEWNERT